MTDEKFLIEYEKLLDKGYCDCNEMNCIDNNSPRRILNIAKRLQQENQELKNQLEEKENQQKEFIEYLENEIERYRKTLSERPTNDLEYNNYKVTDVALEQIKIVLSKYKEIIGGK